MIQRIVGVHPVGTHADNRFEQMQLGIFVNIEFPQAAVLLFLIQVGHQRIHPTGHGLLIRQIGFVQRRLINQLFQQRFREATFHANNHFLRRIELGNQFL